MTSVSVLMTAFNREDTIAEAIQSVLASDYTDFELIVADDASTDSTVDQARRAAGSDARVRIVTAQANQGDYPNRNAAAQQARGRLIKYLDSDDLIYPHALGLMVRAMDAHPNAPLGVPSRRLEDATPYPYALPPEDVFAREFLDSSLLHSGPSGVIMRREAFEAEGGFQVSRFLGDVDLWYRLARRGPTVVFAPGLVWWRQHPGQEIRASGSGRFYLEQGFALDRDLLQDPALPIRDGDRNRAWRRVRQHHARRILRTALRDGDIHAAWRIFRASGLSLLQLLQGLRPYAGTGRA